MGERKRVDRILIGSPRKGDHLEDPGLDGSIILNWFFKKWKWWAGGAWTEFNWPWIGTVGGFL
jgi:hypothetical protein